MNDFWTLKNICVFGGTGTIGSLIVKYLLKQDVQTIRVFSNDENSLWKKKQEWNDIRIRYLLGDIRNYRRVKRALHNIDYVFNCVAIKHVPFAEYDPTEAVTVNVIGLENVIDASIEQNVKKLLHISTDKATNPTCSMGATKMLSERLLQIRWAQNPRETQMVCIRSGNVYGSRGSIVRIINKKKEKNEPIPITDLNMTRFFIFPEQLIDFIIKAFIEGKEGEIWIPKMEEIKIIDLIKEIVGIKYPLEYIGKRKGEKLSEKLISNDEKELIKYEDHQLWILNNNFKELLGYE